MEVIKQKYSGGVVTDPEPMERGKDTLSKMVNMEYTFHDEVLKTRRALIPSDLTKEIRDTLPNEYIIASIKTFSFNPPVDKKCTLVIYKSLLSGDIKIFINKFYNPAPPNSEPPTYSNNYENYISSYESGLLDKWVELTEVKELGEITVVGEDKIKVDTITTDTEDLYRGCFLWNKTKYFEAVSDEERNMSWACIEKQYDEGGQSVFQIQNRAGLLLSDMGWANNHYCYLVRYPVVVLEALRKGLMTSQGGRIALNYYNSHFNIIKTNTSIVILTGEEGNLELCFNHKDEAKETGEAERYVVGSIEYSNPNTINGANVINRYSGITGVTFTLKKTWHQIILSGHQLMGLHNVEFIENGTKCRMKYGTMTGGSYPPNFIWITVMNGQVIPDIRGIWEITRLENESNGKIVEFKFPLQQIISLPTNGYAKLIHRKLWTWTKQKNEEPEEPLLHEGWNLSLTKVYNIYDGASVKFNHPNFGINDTVKITMVKTTAPLSALNKGKYCGWWLDYQVPQFNIQSGQFDNTAPLIKHYPSLGLRLKVEAESEPVSGCNIKAIALTVTYNKRHRYILFKGVNMDSPADTAYRAKVKMYHHYSRRITGIKRYGTNINSVKDDIKGYEDYNDKPYYNVEEERYIYNPIYTYDIDSYEFEGISIRDPDDKMSRFDGSYFMSDAEYLIEEPITVNTTKGIFTHGRIFFADGSEGDAIRYSLLFKEDVFPKQNKRYIDPNDKDVIISLKKLGANILILKENALYLVNIEQTPETGWRLLEIKRGIGAISERMCEEIPQGVIFGNREDIYLITTNGEIRSLLGQKRQKEWQNLSLESCFFRYDERERRLWVYIEDGLFWICHFKQDEVVWYDFKFSTPFRGIEINEDGLHLYGDRYIYLYPYTRVNINRDAGGGKIAYRFSENFIPLPRNKTFHLIETLLSYNYTKLDNIELNGNEEVINVSIKNENNQMMCSRQIMFNVFSGSNGAVIKNQKANRQRTVALEVSGELTYCGLIEFTEVIHKLKPLLQMVKSGYATKVIG